MGMLPRSRPVARLPLALSPARARGLCFSARLTALGAPAIPRSIAHTGASQNKPHF